MTRDVKAQSYVKKNSGEIYEVTRNYRHDKDFYVWINDYEQMTDNHERKITSFAVSECTIEEYPQFYL